MASTRDQRHYGLISRAVGLKQYMSKWAVRETAGTTAVVKFRDAMTHLAAPAAADGAAGNSTIGLHMITGTVAVSNSSGSAGGEQDVKGSGDSNWVEMTSAGSTKIEVTAIPRAGANRSDPNDPLRDAVLGRRLYITKAGAPATTVSPTNAQWFLAVADGSTTITSAQNNIYLPKASIVTNDGTQFVTPLNTTLDSTMNLLDVRSVSTLKVASTTNAPAAGIVLVAVTNGSAPFVEVSYTAVGTSTTLTGCSVAAGVSGILNTSGVVKIPMNALVATDQGWEMIQYTGITTNTLTGCTGGRGLMATSGTIKQPMIPDNYRSTYTINVADGSLPATHPPILDTSGALVGEVYLSANQTADSPNGWGIAFQNDGGLYVEVTSGTVSWQAYGQ